MHKNGSVVDSRYANQFFLGLSNCILPKDVENMIHLRIGFNMLHTQNTIKDFSMTTLCIGPFKILCITNSDIALIVLFHLFQRMLSQIYSCPFYTFNEKYS